MLVLVGLSDPMCHMPAATTYCPTPYREDLTDLQQVKPEAKKMIRKAEREVKGTVSALSPRNS